MNYPADRMLESAQILRGLLRKVRATPNTEQFLKDARITVETMIGWAACAKDNGNDEHIS